MIFYIYIYINVTLVFVCFREMDDEVSFTLDEEVKEPTPVL